MIQVCTNLFFCMTMESLWKSLLGPSGLSFPLQWSQKHKWNVQICYSSFKKNLPFIVSSEDDGFQGLCWPPTILLYVSTAQLLHELVASLLPTDRYLPFRGILQSLFLTLCCQQVWKRLKSSVNCLQLECASEKWRELIRGPHTTSFERGSTLYN